MAFSSFNVSTKTVMAYSSVTLDLEKVYEGLPVTETEYRVKKKSGLPDIRSAVAPEGSIISLRHKNNFRGIVTNPEAAKNQNTKKYFLNQVTCILSVEGKNLHIMIFRGNFKIPGCQNDEQVKKTVRILWNYIAQIPGSYTKRGPETEDPSFFLETVMMNVDFSLGYLVDRRALNTVMNNEKYEENVKISRFEPTTNTAVNIRMRSSPPEDFQYEVMCFVEKDGEWNYLIKREKENVYIKRRKPKKHTTFLVFGSSKTIVSGRYKESMEKACISFFQIVNENKEKIMDIAPIPEKKTTAKRTVNFYKPKQ